MVRLFSVKAFVVLIFFGLLLVGFVSGAHAIKYIGYRAIPKAADDTYFGFNTLAGVAIDSTGNVYVSEFRNHRILKFDSLGVLVTTWGSLGTDNGQFNLPRGVAIDSADNVYVADQNNHRVQKFDSDGTYITQWGSDGSGDGQFNNMRGITVNDFGFVYVTDATLNRVQKFDTSGSFITQWGTTGSGNSEFSNPRGVTTDSLGRVYIGDSLNYRVQRFSGDGVYQTQWGSGGTGDGQFGEIDPGPDATSIGLGVVADSADNIYITDMMNNRIQKFDSDGNYLGQWGSGGADDGKFNYPYIINIDQADNLYVSEQRCCRIQKFTSTGNFVLKWGNVGTGDTEFFVPRGLTIDNSDYFYVADTGNNRVVKYDSNGDLDTTWGEYGSDPSQFIDPSGIVADNLGNIFVVDQGNDRIQKFDDTGVYITEWGGIGSGDGQFDNPTGIATDTAGNVYVTDTNNNRVQQFDNDGKYITQWGSVGSGDEEFQSPAGIAIDSSDYIYIADTGNNRIQEFDTSFVLFEKWGTYGTANGEFDNPVGIAIDGNDDVYVTEINSDRVQKFDYYGGFITKWGASQGTNANQFWDPIGIAFNSTDELYAVQQIGGTNGLVSKWLPFNQINNLGANVDATVGGLSFKTDGVSVDANESVMVMADSNTVSSLIVDMTSDRDWSGVTAESDIAQGKSFVYGLATAPGAAALHSLYVPIPNGATSNKLLLCPDADSLATVFFGCTNAVLMVDSDPGVSKVNVDGIDYWKVDDQTGTGGMSITTESLEIQVSDATININDAITITVTAKDAGNSTDPNYRGIVHFTETSGTAVLPGNYEFSEIDAGSKVFTDQLIFTETGIYTVTVTDMLDGTLTATSTNIFVGEEAQYSASCSFDIPNSYINLGIPEDMVILPNNNIWYVDMQNYRVVMVSPTGQILRTVGKLGNDFGEFEETIVGITRDNDNNIYVLSYCHVYKFDSNGGFITSWGGCGEGTSEFSTAQGIHYDPVSDVIYVSDTGHNRILKFTKSGAYISQFGSVGSGDGDLNQPVGIYTDSSGKIYVVDTDNHRVQRFNTNGSYDIQFGSMGSGDGELTYPKDLAIASNGNIFVSSQNSQKIQIFDSDGDWVSSWGVAGTEPDQLYWPRYIGFDTNGNLWITDAFLKSLQEFTPTGTLVSAIRNSGTSAGKLTSPEGVAYDSVGNLYILDNGSSAVRLQKFTYSGTYLATIADINDIGVASYHITIKNDNIYVTSLSTVRVFDTSGNLLLSFGASGSGKGEFDEARGIDIDSSGNIYVADMMNHRIEKFDSDGNYLSQWGTEGTGNGEFARPQTIYIDGSDAIYVSDNEDPDGIKENTRIQIFNTSGAYQSTIGSYGWGDGEFTQIGGIARDSTGKIHVSDVLSHKIKVFSAEGVYESSYESYGSGLENVTYPAGLALNPITNTISIADYGNHRAQLLCSGTRIYNLTSSADVIKESAPISLVNSYIDPDAVGSDSIPSLLYFGDYIVSDFIVDMTSDRDWMDVNVTTLFTESKSLVTNLDPVNAPGISDSHSLYIVKQEGQVSVRVCPVAEVITDITSSCTSGYDLVESDEALSTVIIDGITYWKVTGLTGTGIMSEIPVDIPSTTPTITNTATPTNVTPVSTSTPVVTPTPFDTDETCVVNPIQPKCLVNVEITNVTETAIDSSTMRICWDTNTQTKGSIRYGTSQSAVYNSSTDVETDYIDVNHCASISDLDDTILYIYKIVVTSVAGKTASADGDFVIGIEVLPPTGEDDANICKVTGVDNYWFNGLGQVVFSYTSSCEAVCSINYGSSSQVDKNKSNETTGKSHLSILELSQVSPDEDLYYKLYCEFTSLNATPRDFNVSGIIAKQLFLPYYPEIVTNNFFDIISEAFSTPEKTVGAMNTVSTIALATTATMATLAYPQWLSFGFLWFKSRKTKRPWGIVYDSITRKPIAFALVKISKLSGELIKQAVTSTSGTFGFVLDKGQYKLTVEADGYVTYEKAMEVEKQEESISIDVGLSKTEDTASALAINFKIKESLRLISTILFVIGIVLTLIGIIISPNIFNVIILLAYAFQGVIFYLLRTPRGWGKVQLTDGTVLSSVFVKLYSETEGRQLDVQLTDNKGRFGFSISDKGNKDDYLLIAYASGYTFPGKGQQNVFVNSIGEKFVRVNALEMANINIILEKTSP